VTDAEEFFHQLAKEIPRVQESKMIGSLCLKTPNGKSGAMFWKDNIVVKLTEDELQEALSLAGAQLFEPMEGRPMKEWVQIPYTHKDVWEKYALCSVELARKLKK